MTAVSVTAAVGTAGSAASVPRTWRHLAGVAFGVGTQALFALTVVLLFSFLRYGISRPASGWLWTDLLLALQFAVPHSVLLHPRFRDLFRRWFPAEMHGAFFCVCTCLGLLLIFGFWQSTDQVLWDLTGLPAGLMLAGFYGSWIALLYSISLTGLGYQTGWTQWLHWYRGQRAAADRFRLPVPITCCGTRSTSVFSV